MNLLYTTEAVVEGGPRLPTRTVPWRMRARPARNDTRQDALAEGVRPLTPRSCSVSTPSDPSIETQFRPTHGLSIRFAQREDRDDQALPADGSGWKLHRGDSALKARQTTSQRGRESE